jgi:hypothetical protein
MSERTEEHTIRRGLAERGDLPRRARRVRAESLKRGIDYDLASGKRIPINYMATPALLFGEQVRFLHRLSSAVNAMVRRMPGLFLADPAVRDTLPFPSDEEEWVRDGYRPGTRQPLVTRIDVDLPNHHAAGAAATVAFEPNGVSIGGLYYAGEGPRMLADVMLDPPARDGLHALGDPCGMVARLASRHARALGFGRRPRIGILENREWTEGITEMPRLAATFEAAGMKAVLGDPRDLGRSNGTMTLAGTPVDLLYRNMEARDRADVEAEGTRLDVLRRAFRDDRVMSGIAGDFDHKSLWEVLTTERTRHVVPPRLRPLFRRHLLWTRLVRETRTEGPDGRLVDLLPYVRTHRESLVTERAWDRALNAALADPGGWVVQSFHASTVKPFPVVRKGAAVTEDAYICYGVIAIDREVGILGRACVRPVVNVSAGGGLMAVFRRD